MKSILITALIAALGLFGMIYAVGALSRAGAQEASKHPPEWSEGIREFRREDGSICLYHVRGGVTCNWKN